MKRYALLLTLVLIGSTAAWGAGLDSYIPGNFSCPNPCFAPPSPCYTPPTPCVPQTGCCYKPVNVSSGNVTSSQTAVLFGNGLAYAKQCGGVILWSNSGCGGSNFGGGQHPIR